MPEDLSYLNIPRANGSANAGNTGGGSVASPRLATAPQQLLPPTSSIYLPDPHQHHHHHHLVHAVQPEFFVS